MTDTNRPTGVVEGSGRHGKPKDLGSSLNQLDSEEAAELEDWIRSELDQLRQRGIIREGYTVASSWDAQTRTLKAELKVSLVLSQPEHPEEEGTRS